MCISPCTAVGGGLRNAEFQQKLSFCGYGITCAALSLVIVQRRAPCLCNADLCACATTTLMPMQCRSRCDDLHTSGPPHPFSTCCTNTTVCKAIQDMDSGIYCVEGVFADCDQHAKLSPIWWQSDFPKQRSKIPQTQCIKDVFRNGAQKKGLRGPWIRPTYEHHSCPSEQSVIRLTNSLVATKFVFGAPDSSFQSFCLHLLQKSKKQKIRK